MRPGRIADYYGIDAVPGFMGRGSDASRAHLPELTGLRGVAVLIVVVGHLLQRVERFYDGNSLSEIEAFVLGIFATPFSGCRLLFCITGYTLAIYLSRNAAGDRMIAGFSFLRIRMIRIWPPYLAILGSTLLFIVATGYQPQRAYQFYAEPNSLTLSFLVSAVYLHDLVFNTFPRLFPPGWYLEVHFQFLVVGPVLWQLYRKVSSKRRRMLAAALSMACAMILSILVAEHGSRGLRYSVAAFLPYFLVGAFLADLGSHRHVRDAVPKLESRWPIGMLGLVALVALGAPCGAIWWQLPAQLVALAAVMAACLGGQSSFRTAMSGRRLTRIGVASFSIYLVHLQILQVSVPVMVGPLQGYPLLLVSLICALAGLCLVLGLAFAFYWLVERPCVAYSLRRKRTLPPTAQMA